MSFKKDPHLLKTIWSRCCWDDGSEQGEYRFVFAFLSGTWNFSVNASKQSTSVCIADSKLNVVSRKRLVIAHVIPLHPHKRSVIVCFISLIKTIHLRNCILQSRRCIKSRIFQENIDISWFLIYNIENYRYILFNFAKYSLICIQIYRKSTFSSLPNNKSPQALRRWLRPGSHKQRYGSFQCPKKLSAQAKRCEPVLRSCLG